MARSTLAEFDGRVNQAILRKLEYKDAALRPRGYSAEVWVACAMFRYGRRHFDELAWRETLEAIRDRVAMRRWMDDEEDRLLAAFDRCKNHTARRARALIQSDSEALEQQRTRPGEPVLFESSEWDSEAEANWATDSFFRDWFRIWKGLEDK